MNESTVNSIKHVIIAIIIIVGMTINTILLKGAGNSSDIVNMRDATELHKAQLSQTVNQNLEYIELRIAKAEARQDEYYNSLNRRVDIVENKFSRVIENKQSSTVVNTINNTFSQQQISSKE